MRVLVITGLYPPQVAGAAEMYTAWITEALRDRGHEMTVLTSWHGLVGPQTGSDARRLLRFYPSQRFDSSAGIIDQLRSAYLYYRVHNCRSNGSILRQVLGEANPELIYLADPGGLGMNSIVRTVNASGLPVVVHLHNYWLLYVQHPSSEQSNFRNTWAKKFLVGPVPRPRYTSLIAISRVVKDEHVRGGFEAGSIEVIYNGLPPDRIPEVKAERSQLSPRFLLPARIVEEKGVHIAIKAISHLVKDLGVENAHLDIVGDGYAAYLNELRDLSERLGVSEHVTFCGKLDRNILLDKFTEYSAVLVPSLWKEPFGTTVLEAMVRGVPVVASDLGGYAEIIENGRTGLLFRPGDAEQMAEAMRVLLASPSLQEQISSNALELVRGRLSFESYVDKVEEHMRRAL